MEITSHASYLEGFYPICYRRTSSGFEVDFILGDHEIAIEVKSTTFVRSSHLKGLRRFKEEYTIKRGIIVSLDPKPNKTEDHIDILPWNDFLKELWEGNIFYSTQIFT